MIYFSDFGAAGDPFIGNVVLLMGMEGSDGGTTFVDESTVGRTITTLGNAQIDTAQAKFGTSSMLMDTTGDYLTAPDAADLDFGTGEFTIECFIRFDGVVTSICGLVSKYTNSALTASWALIKSGDNVSLQWYNSAGTARTVAGAGSWATGQWYHVAADRVGDVFSVYQDGVRLAQSTFAADSLQDGTGVLQIGRFHSGSTRYWPGWIDEVRITKGEGRYGGNFTPPATAFPRP